MLRASVQSSRALGQGSIVNRIGRQWLAGQGRIAAPALKRSFADEKKPSISDSRSPVLPGSASASTNEPLPPGRVEPAPTSSLSTTIPTPNAPVSESTIPASSIPRIPPAPPAGSTPSATPPPPPSSSDPPPPPPAPKAPVRRPRRTFRNLFLTLIFLTVAGFGGGVYLSRINDNFHDFFTEYIPYGEDAVLYFEEREFRKRFPTISTRPRPRDTGPKVTIPSQSGVSWKVAEDGKSSEGRHTDATKENKPSEALHQPLDAKPQERVAAVQESKKEAKSAPKPQSSAPVEAKPSAPVPQPEKKEAPSEPKPEKPTAESASKSEFKAPEVNEPSRYPAEVTHIDPINITDAQEPIVQDLVKLINDIITVVNADNANDKFTATIARAKSELYKVGGKIKLLKDDAVKEADNRVKSSHEDFDRAAKELIRRLEGEMQEQEARWKDEYEHERQKLQQVYEQRLKAEIDRAQQLNEQRLRNELLEQAVEMKRKFIQEVKDRVEEERNSRLGKLSALSETVNDLEKLTTDWNSVVDANLKTQQLHVAVEAVRANLEKAQTPRPFIRELVALKEIAADDPVVNAAIASINPTAYQRGIPSSAQLIDRFRRVAGEVRKASLLPDEAGVASHASSYLLSKLLFKKKGIADGNDVESILTRTETFLEEGNLDEAAREMNTLTGWAKTLSKDWLNEVRRVLEVQQALDVIATEARLQSLRVE